MSNTEINCELKNTHFVHFEGTFISRIYTGDILDQSGVSGWGERGGGLGLLEGTDPEPLLTFSVIITAAFLFYINIVSEKRTSESLCN